MENKKNFLDKKIILASQSPRRRELLKSLGFNFESIKLDMDESYPSHLKKAEITEFLAGKKSNHYGKVDDRTILITADTIVWKDESAWEKPENKQQAKKMLQNFSDDLHKVYTSVGFTTSTDFKVLTDCAEVHFTKISEEEINYYIDNFNPLDKAGSYGIQDWIGLAKVDRIEGSYFTIMGFPTHLVYQYLSNIK